MKITLQLLLALILGLGLAADRPTLAPDFMSPPALTTIPSVTLKYYEVKPRENERLISAVLRCGPRDSNANARVAETIWRLEWSWPTDDHGKPLLDRTEVKYSAVVLLPRLSSRQNISVDQQLKWQRYLESIKKHEAGHAWHAYKGAAELQQLIRAAAQHNKSFSPFDLKDLAVPFIEKLHANDRSFDQVTEHGRTQGVWWPN